MAPLNAKGVGSVGGFSGVWPIPDGIGKSCRAISWVKVPVRSPTGRASTSGEYIPPPNLAAMNFRMEVWSKSPLYTLPGATNGEMINPGTRGPVDRNGGYLPGVGGCVIIGSGWT